jgi:triosephosphate isomerase
MTRRKIIAGNWKMHKTGAEARAFTAAFVKDLGDFRGCDIVLCPPYTALADTRAALADVDGIDIAAQNVHEAAQGAFTGEVSCGMLHALAVTHCIIGHSERRQFFAETDAGVNRKLKALLAASLTPIVCVGESLEQRKAGVTQSFVCDQVSAAFADLTGEQAVETVIAYEPIWAIGTGLTASPAQAQEVHAWIRERLASLFGPEIAAAVRIQYGGSVKPDNAAELLSQPDIDGALVGGASLDPAGFAAIVKAAA